MSYLTFFHNSDTYLEVFRPGVRDSPYEGYDRPTFYWCSDVYHNHMGENYRDRYFYLFVKNPRKDNVEFRSRHEGGGFHGLYTHFCGYRRVREERYGGRFFLGNEPAILKSYSVIVPDLIAEWDGQCERSLTVLDPARAKGQRFVLLDGEGKLIPFTRVQELVLLLPALADSHPFVQPELHNGEYVYDDWIPIPTHLKGL